MKRSAFALLFCLLIAGLMCLGQSRAQLPLTGAGKGAAGGTVSCTAGASSIAFVGAADGGNAVGTSLTYSYTNGAGSNRLLTVAAEGDTTSDFITGATFNGVTMTLAGKIAPASTSNRWLYLFYLLAPDTGAHNVVISASSSTFIGSGAADYSGVAQVNQPDASTTNGTSSSTNALSTNLTTIQDNDWTVLTSNGFTDTSPPTAITGLARRTFDAMFGTWGLFDSGGPITPPQSYLMTTGYTGVASAGITHVVAAFCRA